MKITALQSDQMKGKLSETVSSLIVSGGTLLLNVKNKT